MRIVIITQNEPFYLAKNIEYLIEILPNHSKIKGCVITNVSPFSKNGSLISKALKTYRIFGFNFFFHYAIKYFFSIFNKKNNLVKTLERREIPYFKLTENINNPKSIKNIERFKPDILVSILGNQIFKKPIINFAPMGILNLHSSLLPKYRGLMPTFWVLKNNEKKTGVSVFYVDEGIDSGPIISQIEVSIDNKSQRDLIEITKKIGMEAISKSIDQIHKNNVNLIPNDSSKMTYYSFPTKEDVIDFKKKNKKFF